VLCSISSNEEVVQHSVYLSYKIKVVSGSLWNSTIRNKQYKIYSEIKKLRKEGIEAMAEPEVDEEVEEEDAEQQEDAEAIVRDEDFRDLVSKVENITDDIDIDLEDDEESDEEEEEKTEE